MLKILTVVIVIHITILIIVLLNKFVNINYENINYEKDTYYSDLIINFDNKSLLKEDTINFPSDTFILYAYYNKNDKDSREEYNLKFLLKNGQLDVNNIIIICHNKEIPDFIPKSIKIIHKENHGYDFEAWYHGLKNINLSLYDKFIFLNSSCIGPFTPVWFNSLNIHWTKCFTNLLTNTVKLVGCTINHAFSKHIQSYFWCTDKIGLNLLLRNNILKERNNYSFGDTIQKLEVGMSKIILDNGFNIKAISMSEMLNITHGDIHHEGTYFKSTINPLEIIFYKNNRLKNNITKLYNNCYK
jgi:lipopolysaccharide biosynthesis protein